MTSTPTSSIITCVCLHCGTTYGTKDGNGVEGVSHGICGRCCVLCGPVGADFVKDDDHVCIACLTQELKEAHEGLAEAREAFARTHKAFVDLQSIHSGCQEHYEMALEVAAREIVSLRDEIEGWKRLGDSIDDALNSGDGTYGP